MQSEQKTSDVAPESTGDLSAGTISLDDGSRYTGHHVKQVPHGHGTQVWPDGTCFTGEFKNGLPDGAGVWTSPDGASYEGNVKENEFHGHGSYHWPDGSSYTGEYQKGKRHGLGVYRWADGSSYEGEFWEDYRHGYGVRIFPSGSRYEGIHVRDKRHGFGVYQLYNRDVYEGEFFNNKRQGNGTYTSGDGTVYRGSFLDGKRHGFGKVILPDGQEFSGVFLNGDTTGELANLLTTDPFRIRINDGWEKKCHLLSGSQEAVDYFTKSVDCDFLLVRIDEIWVALTGEFPERDKKYWGRLLCPQPPQPYTENFTEEQFLLLKGVCHYFDPLANASKSEYILLFNPLFQALKVFNRKELERMIKENECQKLNENDTKTKNLRNEYKKFTQRSTFKKEVEQLLAHEEENNARSQLKFERSLASRIFVEDYISLLNTAKKHHSQFKGKNSYRGSLPTKGKRDNDETQITLKIGNSSTQSEQDKTIKSLSNYSCPACNGKSNAERFLTCAGCLTRICCNCGICAC